MGNQKTKYNTQEVLNYSVDDTIAPPLLQVGIREWDGSGWVKSGAKGTVTSATLSLSDAGTAVVVQASSTPVNGVYVVATGGPVAVGASNAQVTTPTGIILYPGNPPTFIPINDLNTLYAAGASGTRLCYNYFS